MTTEERLEKLERELGRAKRRCRALLAMVGLAVGICVLVWAVKEAESTVQAQPGGEAGKVIRANGFILEDQHGNQRASLGVIEGRTGLCLWDENGKRRAMLWVDKAKDGEPLLAMWDAKGNLRALLSIAKDGPGLDLSDENDHLRARLHVWTDRGPALGFYDEKGKPIWSAP